MKNQWQKGAAESSNALGIGIIIFIIFVMLTQSGDGGAGFSFNPGKTLNGGSPTVGEIWSGSVTSVSPSRTSYPEEGRGTGALSIGVGNASYAYQPYEEYITLDNWGKSSVGITGWQLRNGKDKRPYYSGSTLQRFSADVAIVPQGTRVLSPNGANALQNIVLEPGERAIVTTGSIGNSSPIKITSFKENMCTGYIESLPDYAFSPALARNCPSTHSEAGIENLERSCRKIVESIGNCETPVIGERINDEFCADCYRGQLLSSNCKAYIEEHFSYQGCLANHKNDSRFDGNTWRVFLGRGWEMWADENESIELFDSYGQLVNHQNY